MPPKTDFFAIRIEKEQTREQMKNRLCFYACLDSDEEWIKALCSQSPPAFFGLYPPIGRNLDWVGKKWIVKLRVLCEKTCNGPIQGQMVS